VNSSIQPKKHLGQHFLRDENIARKIVSCLSCHQGYQEVLEVGVGTGALTKWLLNNTAVQWTGFDVDDASVQYVKAHYPQHQGSVYLQDFLGASLSKWFGQRQFGVIGNFPYNISSQILFKVLEYRGQIPEMVGMFQYEVAQRIVSPPGNKVYGILSVLTQAFYEAENLFVVHEHVFVPCPKVKSAVIRLKRKTPFALDCDEPFFFTVVKTAFNQRRKTLRNALRSVAINWTTLPPGLPDKRAEQLGFREFVSIAQARMQIKQS